MKYLNLVLLPALLVSVAAQAADYPVCDDSDPSKVQVYPCQLNKSDAASAFVDMMLANPNGFKKAAHQPKIVNGLMRQGDDGLRVLTLSEQVPQTGKETFSTVRYDMLLSDCLGTDQCVGDYVWTVIEKTQSDGYSYSSTYENYLNQGSQMPAAAPKAQ